MKKVFLLLPALFVATFANAQQEANLPAPETKEVRHILKMVPQEFIVNTFRLDYEFKTGNRSSLQLSPSFTRVENRDYYEDIIGGGADVTAKFYLREEKYALKGFYGGLNASFHHFKINEQYYYNGYYPPYQNVRENKISRIGANMVLGYQFMFGGIVALDLYAGGGIRASRSKETVSPDYSYDFTDPGYNGIAPKAGFSIGIVL